jgi:hypothetical protein
LKLEILISVSSIFANPVGGRESIEGGPNDDLRSAILESSESKCELGVPGALELTE